MFKNMFKSVFKDDVIEFLCAEEDYGIIPTPYPAKKNIPDWYKALPPKIGNKGLKSSTLKRCMPFLDAMMVGYIIHWMVIILTFLKMQKLNGNSSLIR